jgi:hypothetical protein
VIQHKTSALGFVVVGRILVQVDRFADEEPILGMRSEADEVSQSVGYRAHLLGQNGSVVPFDSGADKSQVVPTPDRREKALQRIG